MGVCAPDAGVAGAGAVAVGAVAVTVGDAGVFVVSRAVSRDAARPLSVPDAVCGVDAVETGGAPLLTDSGPQPTAALRATSVSARRAIMRVVEGSMVKGIYACTDKRDARHSSRRRSGGCKVIASVPCESWRLRLPTNNFAARLEVP